MIKVVVYSELVVYSVFFIEFTLKALRSEDLPAGLTWSRSGKPTADHLVFYLECQAPLGMENFRITPTQISASSHYADYSPNYGRLHHIVHSGAWAAKANYLNQWIQIDFGIIQIDFGIVTTVTFVATQGRHNNNQWVTQYKLQYSNDGNSSQAFKEQGENTDKVRV